MDARGENRSHGRRAALRRACGPRTTAIALGLALGVFSIGAQAAEADDDEELVSGRAPYTFADPSESFVYDNDADKQYVRAAIELGLVLGAGWVEYSLNASNQQDFDLGYDWESFREKLVGNAVRFDSNRFDTNNAGHALAGYFFYTSSRSNRLDWHEAYLGSLAASTLWEFIFEFREKVSVNDLVTTSLAGMSLGETTHQLGAYFDRGSGVLPETLAWLFGPAKSLHDRLDGEHARHSRHRDAYGFSEEAEHALALSGGMAFTHDKHSARYEVDALLRFESRLLNMRGANRRGRFSRFFFDGNYSKLLTEAYLGEMGVSHFTLDTRVAPVGWYSQNLKRRRSGGLAGHRVLAGTTVGFDYRYHHFDRQNQAHADRIAGVHAGGLTMMSEVVSGDVRIKTGLDAHIGFASVNSLAVDSYLSVGGARNRIPTVVGREGYYFGWQAMAEPQVELELGRFELGGAARFDSFWSISGIDRDQEQIQDEVDLTDQRMLARGWMRLRPTSDLALSIEGVRRIRRSQLDFARGRRDDTTVLGSLAWTF